MPIPAPQWGKFVCLRGDSQRNHLMLAHICVAALALAPGHLWTRPALHSPANALTALPLLAPTPQPRGRIPAIGSFSSCTVANIASAPTRAAPVMAEGAAQSGLERFSSTFSTLFPLWTLLVAVLGLVRPAVLGSISTDAFTGLLGLLMLSMGITLTIDDFTRVLKQPTIMGVGFAGCYVMMPLLALGLSRVFGLSPALTAGMVLVGSINGGQARTTRAMMWLRHRHRLCLSGSLLPIAPSCVFAPAAGVQPVHVHRARRRRALSDDDDRDDARRDFHDATALTTPPRRDRPRGRARRRHLDHPGARRSVLTTPSRARRLLLGSGSTAYTERADSARGPQVVLVPIVLGMLANAKFPGVVKKIVPLSPVHTMLNA